MEHMIEFFNGKIILITGGGGYLGSRLAKRLLHSGAKIFLLDICFNALSENLLTAFDNIEKLDVDITNKSEIEAICLRTKPDYVFHFCALLQRERNFLLYPRLYDVNVMGTLNLLEALKLIDYKGFYFSSTSEVYGSKNLSPFHEEMVPSPITPYSLTKLMAEHLIETFSETHLKPYTILRVFNFFGPDMPKNFFLSQLLAALDRDEYFEMTEGAQQRDFLYIDDLLDALIQVSVSTSSNGQRINVCSGLGVQLKELSFEVAKILGKTNLLKIGALPYRNNEIWEMIGDNHKLMNIFNWSPSVTIYEGLNKIIRNEIL